MGIGRPPKPAIERFSEKYFIEPNSGCWLWTASMARGGYGVFTGDDQKYVRAHRFSYLAFVGPIPDGLSVLHKCDTRACVRPDHLFVGTLADNIADKTAKNRQAKGESCRHTKLTADQVRLIRSTSGPLQPLADQFNVTDGCISHIRHRRNWRHI